MDPLGALSALGDVTRRRIYDLVAAATDPISREEVAVAAGIGRTLAAYHLDRLAAAGLLTITHERRGGRRGRHRPPAPRLPPGSPGGGGPAHDPPRAPRRPQRPGRRAPVEALRPLAAGGRGQRPAARLSPRRAPARRRRGGGHRRPHA